MSGAGGQSSADSNRRLYTTVAIAAGAVAVASGVALYFINKKDRERRQEAEQAAAAASEKKKLKKRQSSKKLSASVPNVSAKRGAAAPSPAAPAPGARMTASVTLPTAQTPSPAPARPAAAVATPTPAPAPSAAAIPRPSVPAAAPTPAAPVSEEAKRAYELAVAYDLGRPIPAAGTDAKETPSDNLTRRRLAFEHYTKAYELGNTAACFKLSQIYMFGFSATQINEKKAYEVLKRGCDVGAKHCRAFMAWAYLTGSCGLQKNAARAVQLLEQAQKDDATDVYARIYYAHLLLGADEITGPDSHPVKKDTLAAGYMFSKLMPELEALTNGGDLVAQVLLAELLTLGDQAGVTRDGKRAAQLWEQAAEWGHAEAQYMLSVMYQGPQPDAKDPPLFPEDHAKAYMWAERSAAQGFGRAQSDLALMLMDGIGCTADPKRAIKLLEDAAAGGSKEANYALGNYWVQNESAGEAGRRKAFEEYKKAAEGGFPAAMRAIGMCYAEGVGVPRDETKAVQFLMRAAHMGDLEALKLLSQGDEGPEGPEGDDAQMMAQMMAMGAAPPGAGAGAGGPQPAARRPGQPAPANDSGLDDLEA